MLALPAIHIQISIVFEIVGLSLWTTFLHGPRVQPGRGGPRRATRARDLVKPARVRVQVLFFAVLRERLGREQASYELPDGATVASLLEVIGATTSTLVSLLPRVQVAVNQQVVRGERALCDGDEVALIPPVSGGAAPRRIAVLPTPLSLDELVAAVAGPGCGATVTFTGHVRDHGQLAAVERLEYEAYVPMAEQVLGQIADEIERESPGVRVAIQHRTGALAVGEAAVVIAAAAPHRAEAFAACRQAIEQLKRRAPIWKKEVGPDGGAWIGMGP